MLKKLAEIGYTVENEASLVAEIREGNQKAWDAVTRTLFHPLFFFVNEMVHNQEIAEELVQDVFVNFWVKRKNLNITTSLKAYLYRAARNHTLNFIKRRKFEQDYQKKLAETATFESNDTEDKVTFSELEKQLATAIENLPDNCRDIFKLSRYEEMTYKEIAEVLNIPPRSVHYQIGLALKELRTKLKGYASIDF